MIKVGRTIGIGGTIILMFAENSSKMGSSCTLTVLGLGLLLLGLSLVGNS